jgi:hypothetical protein
MAFRFQGSCRDCGHDWEGLCREFECGRVDFAEAESYCGYVCPKCFMQLYVPRQTTRAAFLRWVNENASELCRAPLAFHACELGVRVEEHSLAVIARSPLLFQTCERVARILSEERSPYLSVSIELGSVACAGCGESMLAGDVDSNGLVCPCCESRRARAFGDHHPQKVLVDYQPLDNDVVRGVVCYLNRLAEPVRSTLTSSKRAVLGRGVRELSGTLSRSASPLWDLELDGH